MKKFFLFMFTIIILFFILLLCFCYCAKPSIKLNGQDKITINLNDDYKDDGVSIKLLNIDMSNNYIIDNNVNTEKLGVYTIYYKSNIKFLKNNVSIKRIVEVVDNKELKIVLKGNENITLMEGETYKELGYSATDSNGKDVTKDVIVKNNIDTTKPNTYEVIYILKDSKGKEYVKKRTIIVKKKDIVNNNVSNTNNSNVSNSNIENKKSNVKKVSTKTSVKKNSGTTSTLPILMYHYFYDKNNPPKDKKLNANYMEIHNFEEQMKYLHDEGFYFPTWQEVADFIDGKISLPSNSVVVTVDDGQKSFFELAIPVLQKYNIRATGFIITSKEWSVSQLSKYRGDYIQFHSHTHDMHHGGCTGGHGGIFRCIDHKKGVEDLKKSIQILGSNDVIAYPYGDVTDNTLSITKEAGFKVGVTTVNAKAKKGMNKLELPRVRMSRGVTLNTFKGML